MSCSHRLCEKGRQQPNLWFKKEGTMVEKLFKGKVRINGFHGLEKNTVESTRLKL